MRTLRRSFSKRCGRLGELRGRDQQKLRPVPDEGKRRTAGRGDPPGGGGPLQDHGWDLGRDGRGVLPVPAVRRGGRPAGGGPAPGPRHHPLGGVLPGGQVRPDDGGGGDRPGAPKPPEPGRLYQGGLPGLRQDLLPSPCVSTAQDRCRIQMCQRPALEVGRGFSQAAAQNGAFCGDCASVFSDGCGRLLAVLSDGMGTGGRAAVDGAMTCAMAESLLKAGIGFDSMLETVNAALMAKSGDESLATLDLTCIDLFTGEAEFRKAGAACTLVAAGPPRRGDRGLQRAGGHYARGDLRLLPPAAGPQGDVVVLVSDGVVATGHEWVLDLVRDWDAEENPNTPGPAHHGGGQEAPQRRQGGRHHGPGPYPGVGGSSGGRPPVPPPLGGRDGLAPRPLSHPGKGPWARVFSPGKNGRPPPRNPSPPLPFPCRNAKTLLKNTGFSSIIDGMTQAGAVPSCRKGANDYVSHIEKRGAEPHRHPDGHRRPPHRQKGGAGPVHHPPGPRGRGAHPPDHRRL